ncbi:Dyp-type peroxidase [Tessaracoccus sp. OH4464_COT-324]|uniref:Dyp-type peroxidase n=1 Tax=Tessaracoccus sp. OH4464_COT-324 TaxID=2491059 RepID=UPI000F641113|nr:Dyp-type peroxidase [Tessaracoccus sp. OH4464_COT-324]RRD46582.1 Dyp-type peroxidase [Tessaracoccus sp. OH4464_COT-324]
MSRMSRRGVLSAGAGAITGLGLAGGMWLTGAPPGEPTSSSQGQTYSPFGEHQSGIVTPTPASAELVALDLKPEVDKAALGRLLRVWSTDIAALMRGVPAPGDTMRDLAQPGTSLTVVVGLGPRVFTLDGLQDKLPAGLLAVPPMKHDRLTDEYSGGDLLLWASADDFTTVAYALRRLVSDAAAWANPRWRQRGFWRGVDGAGQPVTGRNLFGQVDGTANPTGETARETIWATDGWLAGGTQLVVRRIAMNLDEWEKLTRNQMERALGRDLAHGAPLSGGTEFSPMDFSATDDDGQPAIPLDAHARLAHPENNRGRRMHRRGLNYSDHTGSGLIFNAFQADITKQFVPVQRTLDDSDALNEWTTAVGSAVFAIPPGMREGGFLGEGLFR